ncbi:hypothetical protein J437_LFUL008709 [Ladona fulva]|uniref:Uncharacterized protein n=1 Tax=Ladona fulva TaxID=123851 RepID=A0A8K0NZN3_LADFU|nr:hypothetical protein J437_LFUL008709 [Ladona fulva]
MKKLPKSLRPSEIVNEYLEGPLKKLNENFDQMLSCILSNSFEQDAVKNLEDMKDSAVNLIKATVEIHRNPIPIYEKVFDTLENPLLSKYSDDLNIFFLLMKGEYYLSQKRSLLIIVKIWGKAIQLVPESPLLLSYPTQLLQTKKSLNIYKEVKEKVRILMSSKKISKANIQCLKNILKLCERGCKNV